MTVYNQPLTELLTHLKATKEGLSLKEVQQRIEHFGYNELKEKKKMPPWLLFLRQFKDFMILILAAAAVLSGLMGEITDTIIILVIIILNAVVGFIQEYRAEKAIEALKKLSITQTQVLREGQTMIIASSELVPGDVVVLEAGNVVPADIRLFETHAFQIDESSLTGESVPADKTDKDIAGTEIPLGDQFNMAFKGTLVTTGRARGLVATTGMQTELGKIAGMLQEKEVPTPLQQRMTKFSKNLTFIVLLICLILFISGILRGEDPFKILLLSISLAVAAIPEALPALITIALARGAARLAKKNALIRKLPAVETLGSVSYICSDKTGTLTQNKMQVVEVYVDTKHDIGTEWSALRLGMLLNHDVKFNDLNEPFGDPTELALVQKTVDDLSFETFHKTFLKYARVAELPFDSDRKCMTTVHHFNGKFIVFTKGASEAIDDTLHSEEEKNMLNTLSDQWASEGIRVLAYAYQMIDQLPDPFTYETVEKNLHFIGLTGLKDPPREEVKVAIQECKTAGIKPVMITGDHPATAKAIAREIGILDDTGLVLTGPELKQLDDDSFLNQVEHTVVYARVSPDQKLRIVRALQLKGHFVSMTGDGVNDAPSLRAANIGVAMGITGTDVSKEAAHLILLDDNFATIVKAVKEGRRIFDNIRKFIKYIMTCNGAEIWTILLAPLLGMPIPLLPIHILWINLVTDGLPALALANEKAEKDVMNRPPRPATESLFADGVGKHIVWVGLLMAGVTLGTQAWALKNELAHWQTMVFTVLALSQLGHVLGVRSERTFLYKQGIFGNLPLLGSVALTFVLQMTIVYVPFMNGIFKTQPLSLKELGICFAASLVVFHAVELEKWVKMRFVKK
ncbi:MAG: cation-translocating P-type ATPase [Saprospiraceae bacterium]|nr:cation-translocating P-type ATPase [Saprospiraceae bacterium]